MPRKRASSRDVPEACSLWRDRPLLRRRTGPDRGSDSNGAMRRHARGIFPPARRSKVERASPIAAWDSFYVIVGSSAAALTGLQFVVMTLISTDEQERARSPEVSAFGTPTVVHFCAALLMSAILSAPWHAVSSAGLALAICGGVGVAYV